MLDHVGERARNLRYAHSKSGPSIPCKPELLSRAFRISLIGHRLTRPLRYVKDGTVPGKHVGNARYRYGQLTPRVLSGTSLFSQRMSTGYCVVPIDRTGLLLGAVLSCRNIVSLLHN